MTSHAVVPRSLAASLVSFAALAGCHPPAPPAAPLPAVTCTAPALPRADAPAPGEAIAAFAGTRVTRIAVTGAGFDATSLAEQMKTQVGQPLGVDTLRDDLRAVWDSGLASRLDVAAHAELGGVALELRVAPPPRVRTVRVDGLPADAWRPFTALAGTLHDPLRLENLTARAQWWWYLRGYRKAKLVATTHAACSGRSDEVDVRIAATLGPRFLVDKLAILGSAVPVGTFEHELGAYNRIGAPFHEDYFSADMTALLERHRARGWLDAALGETILDQRPELGRIAVTAHIVPGTRFRMAVPPITGGTPAQRALVDQTLAPLRGQWYDADLLQRTIDAAAARAGATDARLTWNLASRDGAFQIVCVIEPVGATP